MDINSPGYWKTQLTNRQGLAIRKSMLLDPQAKSSNPSKPAFMAPPPGAKAYHGFPLIPESISQGFALGTVTDYLESDSDEGCTIGDAFVEGPDGSRAGIFWEVNREEGIVSLLEEPQGERWGVYYFTVPYPVKSLEDFLQHFYLMLPLLMDLYKKNRG